MVERAIFHGSDESLIELDAFAAEDFFTVMASSRRTEEVPSGVLQLSWEQLSEGRPAALYGFDGVHWHVVVLLAYQGSVTRLRLRPRSDRGLVLTRRIYGLATAAEREAIEAGCEDRDVAQAGAEAILTGLGELGAGGAQSFTEHLLHAELPNVLSWPQRPPDSVGRVAKVLLANEQLAAAIRQPGGRLPHLLRCRDAVAAAAADLGRLKSELQALAQASHAGARAAGGAAPVLANTAVALGKVGDIAETQLALAAESTTQTLQAFDRLLIWIELVRILDHEVAWYARRHVDTLIPMGPTSRLGKLWGLLQHACVEMAVAISELPETMDRAGDDLHSAVEDFAGYHRWLARFRLQVTKAGLWGELRELRDALDAQLVSVARLERLSATEALCKQPQVDVDVERLARALTRVGDCMENASIGRSA